MTEKSFLVVNSTVKLVNFQHGAKNYYGSLSLTMSQQRGDLLDLALLAIFLATGKSLFPHDAKSYHEHYYKVTHTLNVQ